MTRTATYREALREEMADDRSMIMLGEDFSSGGTFGVAGDLPERCGPERVVQTPISENGFVGVVVGAAMTGMRPVAEIVFLDFLTLATDQKPVRVAARDVPIPSSGPLEQRVIPQLADIIEGCLESLQPV